MIDIDKFIKDIEDDMLKELRKKEETPIEEKKDTNPFQSLSLVELWGLMVKYNDKLTGLITEMINAEPLDPYERYRPNEFNNERNLRDISEELSYTLYLMTLLDNEIYKKI